MHKGRRQVLEGLVSSPKCYCSPCRWVFGGGVNFREQIFGATFRFFARFKHFPFLLSYPKDDLPWLGGTNPYPLAPTITPLLSSLFGGGPGGNSTGPGRKIVLVRNMKEILNKEIVGEEEVSARKENFNFDRCSIKFISSRLLLSE